MSDPRSRLIDRWFPVAAVDEACGTPAGSGLTEKALFTWFASRPIAQARAAALTSLLPDDPALKPMVEFAVRTGEKETMRKLADMIVVNHGGTAPTVLDMFSGRGIIPLEAARAGAKAVGTDLSPVATLAGRLLADYPARDWSDEPRSPFGGRDAGTLPMNTDVSENRLVQDISTLLAEVGRRVAQRVAPYYPRNQRGEFPWAYLWVITLPCDGCKRRFPLFGSLRLRYPYAKTKDTGQSIRLRITGDAWRAEVVDGAPDQQPTYASAVKADGKKRKGKSARCLFCGHIHPLDAVKAKGAAGQYEDTLAVVADTDARGKRFFRLPTEEEITAAADAAVDGDRGWPYRPVPDEVIPTGNTHTVMASGYGYRTFGDLMCARQTRSFVETVSVIRELHDEMRDAGLSDLYSRALASYAASTVCRRLRRSTRGARLMSEGDANAESNNTARIGDLFVTNSALNFQFDFLEAGPGLGPGTWASVCDTAVQAIRKVTADQRGTAVRFRRASATALPMRDASVDVVITDPPYYDMVEYADASDLFHVWLKRVLFDIEPDLFGPDTQEADGLQDKNQEIIVRRVHEPHRVRHDTKFYESMLAKSFAEARRVLKAEGHLVVVFGHSDPDAWRRLLGALHTAGFIVTAAWPSRTESANTGVASIRVTVTIGCRVAPKQRQLGVAAQVDREVTDAVTERVSQWDADGFALEDQLMASYGPAMEVYGCYSQVINPDGSDADLDRYLNIARRAVRDAMRLRVDELPLETFDAVTRFAVFWLRAKGRAEVPKGEARFFAQADELWLDDLRGSILTESAGGFRLRLDDPGQVSRQSSTFEVVRAMVHAWATGGTEPVAAVMSMAERDSSDQQLWAVISDLTRQIPSADGLAKALAGIKRVSNTVSTLLDGLRRETAQLTMFDEKGGAQ